MTACEHTNFTISRRLVEGAVFLAGCYEGVSRIRPLKLECIKARPHHEEQLIAEHIAYRP